MRRRSGANWVRSTQLPHRTLHQAGPQLEQLFAAQDFLAEVPTDEALLERRFAVAEGTTLEQSLAPAGGRWTLQESELRLGGGLDFVAGLDEYAMRIVTALDPTRPLGETLDSRRSVELDRRSSRPRAPRSSGEWSNSVSWYPRMGQRASDAPYRHRSSAGVPPLCYPPALRDPGAAAEVGHPGAGAGSTASHHCPWIAPPEGAPRQIDHSTAPRPFPREGDSARPASADNGNSTNKARRSRHAVGSSLST